MSENECKEAIRWVRTMDNLKPCPFCGGTATHEIFDDGFLVWCRVRCSCGVMLTVPCETGNEAIEAWNERKGEGECG